MMMRGGAAWSSSFRALIDGSQTGLAGRDLNAVKLVLAAALWERHREEVLLEIELWRSAFLPQPLIVLRGDDDHGIAAASRDELRVAVQGSLDDCAEFVSRLPQRPAVGRHGRRLG